MYKYKCIYQHEIRTSNSIRTFIKSLVNGEINRRALN